MDKIILKKLLNDAGVYPSLYSLNGDLLPDKVVLYHSYNEWRVFYFSERGNKENEKIFYSESEACEYMYQYLKRLKSFQ